MEYRTLEQLESIIEACINGNWNDAAENCVKYGFYANDIINNKESIDLWFDEDTDIAFLVELAAEKRNKN
ncbi:MAG: hypothetical protein GY870_02650 [archaeon]|nr:hypothetical protein [archaeon]